jgi:hypothetical protein
MDYQPFVATSFSVFAPTTKVSSPISFFGAFEESLVATPILSLLSFAAASTISASITQVVPYPAKQYPPDRKGA